MEEKFQRGSIVVNKGAQEFNSKIVILVTGDRSKRDDHFSGVCISTYNHQITPVGEFSDTWHLRKFEKLFDSFEGWLIANQKPQTNPVWVKASEYDMSKGGMLFYRFDGPTLKSIGIGHFVGDLFHGVNLDVFPKWDWKYLYILDESAPSVERESDAVAFAEWLDLTRNSNNEIWKDMSIWGKEDAFKLVYDNFKQQKKNNENS